jgi:DNA ligase-associated metallophosphoesterase
MNDLTPTFAPRCLAGRATEAEVALLAERAVFWSSAATLLVADLHWGKCETIRVLGAPLPQGILEADLQRLDNAIAATGARRVIVLGDLIHAGLGLTDWLVESVARWRRSHPGIELLVIPGNHDRRIGSVADAWGLDVAPLQLREGPFVFQHDPGTPRPAGTEECYTWAGHIHPIATLRARGDEVRVPCFRLGPRLGVLPAFSRFTSGTGAPQEDGEEVYAIAAGRVIRVPV